MVKPNRKLCGDAWWGERGKSPTAEVYMAEVGGRVFLGVREWFYMCVND